MCLSYFQNNVNQSLSLLSFLKLHTNGWVYGSLAISRHIRIKLQVKFHKSTKLAHTTVPPMNYIPCYGLGIIHYQAVNCHCITKFLFFKVGCLSCVGAGRAGRLFLQTLAFGLACVVCRMCLTAAGKVCWGNLVLYLRIPHFSI
jgi:hypothetical protein